MKNLINKIRELEPAIAFIFAMFVLTPTLTIAAALYFNSPPQKAKRERYDRWLFDAWNKAHPSSDSLSFEEWSALRERRLLPSQNQSSK